MKKSILYITGLMLACGAFNACEDDFETPPVIAPTTDLVANTTIAEAKEAFWQSDRNYVATIGQNQDGQDIIIRGRVCSSDKSGNIYKNFVIYDGTAALTVAADTNALYKCYAFGQEVVINLTGMKIGGYNGLMQLGAEGSYQGKPSMTFMSSATMESHCFADGLAHPELVDTALVTLPQIAQYKGSQQSLINWQSRLVRIDNVCWEDAGQPFATAGTSANRYVKDSNGNRLLVRNSGYATFASQILPSGYGSLVGILSYYGTDWQLLLIDIDGCIGFDGSDNPDTPTPPADGGTGAMDSPFTVDQIIAGSATGTGVWTTGYIVGYISDMTMDTSVFSADATVKTNLLLAASADETDYNKCIPVQLPAGNIRDQLNLQDHPDVYKKQISLRGDITSYFKVTGIKNTSYYAWGDKGQEETIDNAATFTKVSAVTAGKTYIFVTTTGIGAGVLGSDKEFGYLPKTTVKVDGDKATASASDGYTFEAAEGGFYIKDSLGRYLWMDETHSSFQVSSELPAEAAVWSVTADSDGTFTVANIARSKSVQYSAQYNSWGSYSAVENLKPVLFEKN